MVEHHLRSLPLQQGDTEYKGSAVEHTGLERDYCSPYHKAGFVRAIISDAKHAGLLLRIHCHQLQCGHYLLSVGEGILSESV